MPSKISIMLDSPFANEAASICGAFLRETDMAERIPCNLIGKMVILRVS